jgi:hypothetical protein
MISWLEASALAEWARTSPSLWAYPTLLTLHTMGLGVVVGACTVIDLRLLGFARRISLPTLAPLFPLVWWAFAVNAVTGFVLFIADATTKSGQWIFYVKLACIALALGATVAIRRIVRRGDAPVGASGRALAIVSLVLWTGAIIAGRLMAYVF